MLQHFLSYRKCRSIRLAASPQLSYRTKKRDSSHELSRSSLPIIYLCMPYSSSISSSLALTGWPSFTRTDLTVPAVRAVMAVSIFMASMMIST